MRTRVGTVINVVPHDEVPIVVVEIGEGEPVSVAHNLKEVRERNLKRGDAVSVAFADNGAPVGLLF